MKDPIAGEGQENPQLRKFSHAIQYSFFPCSPGFPCQVNYPAGTDVGTEFLASVQLNYYVKVKGPDLPAETPVLVRQLNFCNSEGVVHFAYVCVCLF